MTNEQYTAKCEATRKFREVVAEYETEKTASYEMYTAYYIIKHGLYRDQALMKAYLDDQQTKTHKLELRWSSGYYGLFHGWWKYTSFHSDEKEWQPSYIIVLVLKYVPEEFKETVLNFDKEYAKS